VLRGGAHLAAVEGQREGDVAAHPGEVVGGVDDDRVDAGLLGVDDGVGDVGFEPVAVRGGAGEVDDAYLGAGGEHGGQLLVGGLGGELDEVRVVAGPGEDLAGDGDGDRQRQDRPGVRLDDHRVAGGQGGEEGRVGVPGREGVAADHQGHAAADDVVRLRHLQRIALAGGLLP